MCRSGRPRAWYCPQSQSDHGAARPTCQRTVRVPEDTQLVQRARLEQHDRERRERRHGEPQRRNAATGRRPGYVSHSGATMSEANFVQPDSAAKTPRATGDETSQNPR